MMISLTDVAWFNDYPVFRCAAGMPQDVVVYAFMSVPVA